MLRALLFASLALMLASCTQYSGKTPPKVVEGVLDARDRDLSKDGPIDLRGDWEVFPGGVLFDEEVTARPPSADFVAMPWGEAHHKSRSGLDVDESMWVALRVHVKLPERAMGTVLEFSEDVAELPHRLPRRGWPGGHGRPRPAKVRAAARSEQQKHWVQARIALGARRAQRAAMAVHAARSTKPHEAST